MPTSFDYLLTQAVSRIYLDNVDHIQSSWVTQGMKIGQVALEFGADDLGSIMIEENVVSAAGTTYRASTDDFVRTIKVARQDPGAARHAVPRGQGLELARPASSALDGHRPHRRRAVSGRVMRRRLLLRAWRRLRVPSTGVHAAPVPPPARRVGGAPRAARGGGAGAARARRHVGAPRRADAARARRLHRDHGAARRAGSTTIGPVLGGGTITGPRQSMTQLEQSVSGNGIAGGVNGDFFSGSNAIPSGIVVTGGALQHAPTPARSSIGFDANGAHARRAHLVQRHLEGQPASAARSRASTSSRAANADRPLHALPGVPRRPNVANAVEVGARAVPGGDDRHRPDGDGRRRSSTAGDADPARRRRARRDRRRRPRSCRRRRRRTRR